MKSSSLLHPPSTSLFLRISFSHPHFYLFSSFLLYPHFLVSVIILPSFLTTHPPPVCFLCISLIPIQCVGVQCVANTSTAPRRCTYHLPPPHLPTWPARIHSSRRNEKEKNIHEWYEPKSTPYARRRREVGIGSG